MDQSKIRPVVLPTKLIHEIMPLDTNEAFAMPVNPGSSDEARQENIKAEIDTGKYPRDQAIAIGYSEQRQAKKRERKERREPTRRS